MSPTPKKFDLEKLEGWRKDRILRVVWAVSSVFFGLLASLAFGVYLAKKGFFEASDPDLPFFLHWKFFLMTILWICGVLMIPVAGVKLYAFLYRRIASAEEEEQETRDRTSK